LDNSPPGPFLTAMNPSRPLLLTGLLLAAGTALGCTANPSCSGRPSPESVGAEITVYTVEAEGGG
jgi:hypothetical protein